MSEPSGLRPWMTVVIASYNSSRFLDRIAMNLSEQETPGDDSVLEVLLVDGGSTDDTVIKAKQLGFMVLENPDGDPISAKFIGLNNAKARLVCILDHDEFLVRTDSLLAKFEFFRQTTNLRAVVSAGYRFKNDVTSNMYASEFGDPVSMMIYRSPNNEHFKLTSFQRHLKLTASEVGKSIFIAASEQQPILCEMAAGAGVIDIDFFRLYHPEMFESKNIFPHAYYLLDNTDCIGMIHGDAVLHDSAESWSVVRSKIVWRLNNAINETDISNSGFSGRSHTSVYSPRLQKIKFSVYCLTLVWPFVDALWLAATRRRWGYLNHFLLTYFVVFKTVQMKFRGAKGKPISAKRYGEN